MISKRAVIKKGAARVEFDLEELPDGEYELKLMVNKAEKNETGQFLKSLKEWKSGLHFDETMTFRREDMYGDDGR